MRDNIPSAAPCCDASAAPGFEADRPSAVAFANRLRVHVALPTTNLEAALAFYEGLFEQPATKVKAGYAKFELAEPPLNFSLNEVDPGTGRVAPPLPHHLGLQVKSTGAVAAYAQRMMARGVASAAEKQVACCYAVQDKVWLTDPDGHRWEVFVVTDPESDARTPESRTTASVEGETPCCGPVCCA